jgi:hypothetical protein
LRIADRQFIVDWRLTRQICNLKSAIDNNIRRLTPDRLTPRMKEVSLRAARRGRKEVVVRSIRVPAPAVLSASFVLQFPLPAPTRWYEARAALRQARRALPRSKGGARREIWAS